MDRTHRIYRTNRIARFCCQYGFLGRYRTYGMDWIYRTSWVCVNYGCCRTNGNDWHDWFYRSNRGN
jgi:hypothetical protein